MIKRITAIVLTVAFCLCAGFPAFAAKKPASVEELVNAMTLEPKRPEGKQWTAIIEYVDATVKDKKTNFEKMNAVYDKIIIDREEKILGKKKLTDDESFDYTSYLQCAFEILGFRTYGLSGHFQNGDYQWTRTSMVGVDLGGEPYVFDAWQPALEKAPKESCFAVRQKSTKLFIVSNILKWYYKSPYEWEGAGTNSDEPAVKLPEEAEKRAEYHAAITGIDSGEYKRKLPPITVYDGFGKSHTLYFN
jgi:hypothetical protein